ncbi:MAG TPA: hypothetical protein VHK90_16875 [Thermoanaerobaculia bacterium]|nr:hypothetical protein [Thermoanaerobaculia bacterium]
MKQLLVFRVGQTSARSTARMIGLGKLATIVGLIAGYRAWRAHRHA